MKESEITVIAPWGDPANWYYAEYVLEDSRERAFTSLAALAKAYTNANILIAIADTLASPPVNSYNDVINSAKNYAEKFLCNLKASITVLPGVIKQANREFKGSPTDYYYAMLKEILETLKKDSNTEIVLDLTHGVNYMPSLTLKAVEEAASITSLLKTLKHRREVRLSVYNSDPVIPPPNTREQLTRRNRTKHPCNPRDPKVKPLEIKINRVLKLTCTTLNLISNIESLDLRGSPHIIRLEQLPKEHAKKYVLDKETTQEFKTTVREAQRILKMLRYGLIPLLLYYTSKRGSELREKLEKTIDKAVNLWNQAINVKTQDNNITVERYRRFDEGYRLVLYAYYVLEPLVSLVENQNPHPEIRIEVAKKLVEALGKTVAIIKAIHDVEISKLKKAKETSKIGNTWTSLSKVYSVEVKPCDLGRFIRDLLAHGGWHTEVVEVKLDQTGEIIYRVNEDFKCQNRNIWSIIDSL